MDLQADEAARVRLVDRLPSEAEGPLSANSQNQRTFLICTFHFGSLHNPQFDPRNILLAD